ncbi:MAG: DUF669 domain-containing protein [Selenomonadaceae bacterium]|nr:DUF669 domain-containing protein [Selenomonadaceae bacterium]
MATYTFTNEQWNANKAAKPGEFSNLPAGGYVCKIVDAEFTTSKAGNDMLNLNVDIAEGDYTNYFQNFADRFKNWNNNAVYRQLILDSSKNVSSFFKGLLEIIEDSNSNFTAYANGGVDNKALVGKLIGFVFADEEYQKQNGDIATRAVVRTPKTVAEIRDGDFTVPPIKKMDPSKIKPKTNSDDAKKSGSPAPLEDPPF